MITPVILVEQDPDVGELLALYVGPVYKLVREADIDKAIALISEEKPAVAIFDVTKSQSVLDGAIAQVLASNPQTNVCVIIDDNNEIRELVKQKQVHNFLQRPLSSFDIQAALDLYCHPQRKDFSFKKANILIVEDSAAIKPVIGSVLRAIGFKTMHNVNNVKEAIAALETTPVDWVITGLYPQGEMNAFHILRYILTYERLKNVRVTFTLEPAEMECLPAAFALGLFSYIEKPLTKASLQNELKNIFNIVTKYSGNFFPCTIDIFRNYLKSIKKYEVLVAFEQALIELLEHEAPLFLHFAEAQFLQGQIEAGMTSAYQAVMMDKSLKENFNKIISQYVKEEDRKTSVPPIGSCLVVDSDEMVCNFIEGLLKKLQAQNIHIFHDGQSAFDWLRDNPEPNVIIMEWRLAKLSAPVLVQRIKQLKYHRAHVIICSSLIQKEDFALLKEMGISIVLPKPVMEKKFLASVVALLQQERNPQNSNGVELKVRKLLEAGDLQQAKVLSKSYFAEKSVSPAEKLGLKAEIAYAEGKWSDAKAIIMRALSMGGHNIIWINLLGKCLLKLNDYPQAAKCFEKAQQVSPQNLERLCALAQMNSELGDHEASQKYLHQAEKIDAEGQMVKEAKVNCAINAGQTEQAKELFSSLEKAENVISYLNNQAIVFSHQGDYTKSITLYENAMQSIPEGKTEYQAIVAYNLALAYVKLGDLGKALSMCEQAVNSQNPRILKRASSLKERIVEAQAQGKPLQLKLASIEIKKGKETAAAPMETVTKDYIAQAGEVCLYNVFHNPEELPQAFVPLLEAPLAPLQFKEQQGA